MDTCSTVQHRMKNSSSDTSITCLSFVKFLYDMGDVNLMDQKTTAYGLDRGSKFKFYFQIFLDLMIVALVNHHYLSTTK